MKGEGGVALHAEETGDKVVYKLLKYSSINTYCVFNSFFTGKAALLYNALYNHVNLLRYKFIMLKKLSQYAVFNLNM